MIKNCLYPVTAYQLNGFVSCRLIAVVAGVLSLLSASQAFAGVTLETACRQAFVERKTSDVFNVGKHGFKLKPGSVTRTGDSISVSGFFVHVIKGRDDKVHYSIKVSKGQPYTATIESIESNGLFGGGGKATVGVKWAGKIGGGLAGAWLTGGVAGAGPGVGIGEKVSAAVLKGLNAIQRKLIGDWSPSAPVVLDGLANYFANQL